MSCPDGYTLRKGYTRKFSKPVMANGFTVRRKGRMYTVRPKANAVTVDPTCVKNRVNGTGTLRKGELIKYGYQYRLSDTRRHKALEKAVKQYGAKTVYKKLNAAAKISERAPDLNKIFVKDRNWVLDKFKK
jgi:hypothetical protein